MPIDALHLAHQMTLNCQPWTHLRYFSRIRALEINSEWNGEVTPIFLPYLSEVAFEDIADLKAIDKVETKDISPFFFLLL